MSPLIRWLLIRLGDWPNVLYINNNQGLIQENYFFPKNFLMQSTVSQTYVKEHVFA